MTQEKGLNNYVDAMTQYFRDVVENHYHVSSPLSSHCKKDFLLINNSKNRICLPEGFNISKGVRGKKTEINQ